MKITIISQTADSNDHSLTIIHEVTNNHNHYKTIIVSIN